MSDKPRLSLIVAMSRNRVIGVNNTIPWRLPGDLALFKQITMGHHIIMGRNTWESIGRLLPGRTTVIVTRQPHYKVLGALTVDSLDTAIAASSDDDEIFVIGGAQLYATALPHVDRIYLTLVDADIAGDTHMPEFNLSDWERTTTEKHMADDRNPYDYQLTVYDRLR